MAIEAITSASPIFEGATPKISVSSSLEIPIQPPKSIEEIKIERGYKWLEYLQGITNSRSQLPPSRSWEIPSHLTKESLVKKRAEEGQLDPEFWKKRSVATERRVKRIIKSQTRLVTGVWMNPPDTEGSDLKVFFVNGFPIREVKIEVKSSSKAVTVYKEEIRDDLIKANFFTLQEWYDLDAYNKEKIIKGWLTEHHVILINGGVVKNGKEKTRDDILYDSFYPQLIRIVSNELAKRSAKQAVQVFPAS